MEKIDKYGLDTMEVERVIKQGMKWKENNKIHASMAGIECVFIKEESILFIITVYMEGAKK